MGWPSRPSARVRPGARNVSPTPTPTRPSGARQSSARRRTFRSRLWLDALIIVGLLRGLVQPGVSQAQALDWPAAPAECCAEAALSGVRIAGADQPLRNHAGQQRWREGWADHRVGCRQPGLAVRHLPRQHRGAVDRGGACWRPATGCSTSTWPTRTVGIPGAGHLDFAQILDVVAGSGYGGFVSGEFMPRPDADTAAERAIAHLRSWSACEFIRRLAEVAEHTCSAAHNPLQRVWLSQPTVSTVGERPQ